MLNVIIRSDVCVNMFHSSYTQIHKVLRTQTQFNQYIQCFARAVRLKCHLMFPHALQISNWFVTKNNQDDFFSATANLEVTQNIKYFH